MPAVGEETAAAEKKPIPFQGEPWIQQPGESKEAFEAFAIYRDMGAKRSNAKVGRELSKSKALMDRWSSRWSWVRRSEMYDLEQDRQYNLDLREQRRLMAKRHAEQSMSMQNLALKVLKKKFGDDFSKITAKSMSNGELLRFLVDFMKAEKTSLGEPETIQEQQITGGTADNDRKPFVPLTYAGRIDEAMVLLETARARAANGVDGNAS